MQRIRDKLYTDIIKTVKGVGYRIDEEQWIL
jgi:DNA-binding response OmpR family regulator